MRCQWCTRLCSDPRGQYPETIVGHAFTIPGLLTSCPESRSESLGGSVNGFRGPAIPLALDGRRKIVGSGRGQDRTESLDSLLLLRNLLSQSVV